MNNMDCHYIVALFLWIYVTSEMKSVLIYHKKKLKVNYSMNI
jgi:hypothetical protein